MRPPTAVVVSTPVPTSTRSVLRTCRLLASPSMHQFTKCSQLLNKTEYSSSPKRPRALHGLAASVSTTRVMNRVDVPSLGKLGQRGLDHRGGAEAVREPGVVDDETAAHIDAVVVVEEAPADEVVAELESVVVSCSHALWTLAAGNSDNWSEKSSDAGREAQGPGHAVNDEADGPSSGGAPPHRQSAARRTSSTHHARAHAHRARRPA